jgi:hypothetical protein
MAVYFLNDNKQKYTVMYKILCNFSLRRRNKGKLTFS